MGKGIALRFKQIYPAMFREYQGHCEKGLLTIGKLHLYQTPHKWILNFPTKKHWRSPSHVEYIDAGLRKFASSCTTMGITSIAFPALGCGNGELDFTTQVKPLMDKHLRELPLSIFVYPGRQQTTLPEHMDTERIQDWLRSDPGALPFDEVWLHLLQILAMYDTFNTLQKGSAYKARAANDPPGIQIRSHGKLYNIDRVILLDLWQQIRDYGFTHRNIVPDHYRISYLLPIFERLPYVRRVESSTSFAQLDHKPKISLQLVPYDANAIWASHDMFAYAVNAT